MLLDVKDPVVDTANRLIIEAKGQKNGLRVSLKVAILPPEETRIQAVVEGKCETTVPIDSGRPGEGFKPVMLSSMRVGDGHPSREWDARAVIIEGKPDQEFDDRVATNAFFLPPEPDTRVKRFGFRGGKSDFQPGDPAPTVEVTFSNTVRIAGYRTQSTNHDDDNLGLWAGFDTLVDSWTYTITAMRPAD